MTLTDKVAAAALVAAGVVVWLRRRASPGGKIWLTVEDTHGNAAAGGDVDARPDEDDDRTTRSDGLFPAGGGWGAWGDL